MTDIVEVQAAPPTEQIQEVRQEPLSFEDQVKDLLAKEAAMKESRVARDEYKAKIEAEVETTLEKMELKKK